MTGEVISMMAQGTLPAARLDEPVLRAGSPADIAHFSEAMSPVAEPDAVASVARAANADGPGLGDSILRAMEAAGSDYRRHTAQVNDILSSSGSEISTIELMRIQVHMVDASLKVDMISRTVHQSIQHIDSLTKMQ